MPRAPEAGKGRCCHPVDTSWSCSWTTGASWHPAFIRPVGGRGRGLAAIRTQPAFRKPQATGPVPSHHSWREGKRGKKKKVCTPPAQEKQLGILHDGRRATQNSNEKQPQQSPWPSLRPTRAVHADGAGGTAPTPEAVTGNAHWPQPVQGTGSPDPCKEERGKKTKQPIETGYTWDLTCHTWAWIPRKLSSLNSTEAPQHSPRRYVQQSRHRYKSPPTDERRNHTWSL